MKRVRIVVSGVVQGVFYRATCARLARERGLSGFVRNMPDGRVEAAFEGRDDDVDAMIEWCRHGPELARVETMEVSAQQPIGETTFRVTR